MKCQRGGVWVRRRGGRDLKCLRGEAHLMCQKGGMFGDLKCQREGGGAIKC